MNNPKIAKIPIRVLLVSDFLILLQGISSLIESRPQHFSLVGSAEHHHQLAELMMNIHADVVLLDMDSTPDNILNLVDTIRTLFPAKILLITRLDDTALQDKAIIHGVQGIIYHNTTPELLLTAIEKVHEGQIWLNNEATGRIFINMARVDNKSIDSTATKIALLTERELDIFTFIARNSGESGKAIANNLNISESTLRNHLTSI
jgi:DNA-binding NarL/FixJ family response regulator